LAGQGYCGNSVAKINASGAEQIFSLFNAVSEKNMTKLYWHTPLKTVSGFEVLRKKNENNSDWERLNFVESAYNLNIYEYEDEQKIKEGKLYYRLKLLNNDGGYAFSEIKEVTVLPTDYALYQNYPNPFNPVTKIKFSIPEQQRVSIKIFNQLGEEVTQLINSDYETGYHEIEFNAINLASGVYFYRIEAGSFSKVKKLMLLK
jgi:hypothetical protein